MKNLFALTVISTLIFSSCTQENCGECWATVDGQIEESTKTGEVCDNDYETKKAEKDDVILYMETIYPGSAIEYTCQDN
ncbi:MAG: hypothetical protein JXQ87_07380 [Bacteroidia bacterium]